MDKWEYKVIRKSGLFTNGDFNDQNMEAALNYWGQQGFELVCSAAYDTGGIASLILKRKVIS